MKLSAFTDYSLRLLIYLAAEPGRRATVAEVAGAFGVSEHHLRKVAHELGRAGWLHNVRGHGGGLELAVDPRQIAIGDVVRRTEGSVVAAECFAQSGSSCAIGPVCRLRGVFAEAIGAFDAVLGRHTLADVAHNPRVLSQRLSAAAAARLPAGVSARKAAGAAR